MYLSPLAGRHTVRGAEGDTAHQDAPGLQQHLRQRSDVRLQPAESERVRWDGSDLLLLLLRAAQEESVELSVRHHSAVQEPRTPGRCRQNLRLHAAEHAGKSAQQTAISTRTREHLD